MEMRTFSFSITIISSFTEIWMAMRLSWDWIAVLQESVQLQVGRNHPSRICHAWRTHDLVLAPTLPCIQSLHQFQLLSHAKDAVINLRHLTALREVRFVGILLYTKISFNPIAGYFRATTWQGIYQTCVVWHILNDCKINVDLSIHDVLHHVSLMFLLSMFLAWHDSDYQCLWC